MNAIKVPLSIKVINPYAKFLEMDSPVENVACQRKFDSQSSSSDYKESLKALLV